MFVRLRDVRIEFPLSKGKKVALDDINLEFKTGERIGIIGRNGAGKTTLLQIIAGMANPSFGTVEVDGHINCVMTLGVGLREELSGRENIYIDGEINGKSRRDTEKIIDQIIEFADIGRFIDYPVKTYSTGMKSRLSFAMITHIEPGILMIDEALSAGDSEFSQKASQKMKDICDRGRILIVVSHSMESIVKMCNRCVWIDNGRVVMDGEPTIVTEAYMQAIRQHDETDIQARLERVTRKQSMISQYAVERVEFLDSARNPRHVFDSHENVSIRIYVIAEQLLQEPDIEITFDRLDGNSFVRTSSRKDGFDPGPILGKAVFEAEMGPVLFGPGIYQVHVCIIDREANEHESLAELESILKIETTNGEPYYAAYSAPVLFDYRPA